MASITPTPGLPSQHHGWSPGLFPEILGYLGAALVVGAGLSLVAQSWTDWSVPVQIAAVASATATMYVAAGILSLTAGGRGPLAEHLARRRLICVLASLAAPLAAITTGLALDAANFGGLDRERYLMLIVFSVALLAGAFAAWWVPGIVPTITVSLAAFMWVLMFIGSVTAPWESPLADPVILFFAGAAWLIITPRLLPPRVLTEALGIAGFIFFQIPTAFMAFSRPIGLDPGIDLQMDLAIWFSRVALIGFAVVALILFARGSSWAWAVGGVLAAGAGAMSLAGQTLGLIAGLFVTGAVLLAASGILIISRTRREKARSHLATTSAPEQ